MTSISSLRDIEIYYIRYLIRRNGMTRKHKDRNMRLGFSHDSGDFCTVQTGHGIVEHNQLDWS
jgi:hypothetical protein